MSAKEKAKELFHKMYYNNSSSYDLAKQCALIAVGEIMRFTVEDKMQSEDDDDVSEYWRKVKEEINKL